jgi:hypothetical protein
MISRREWNPAVQHVAGPVRNDGSQVSDAIGSSFLRQRTLAVGGSGVLERSSTGAARRANG